MAVIGMVTVFGMAIWAFHFTHAKFYSWEKIRDPLIDAFLNEKVAS
jgi:hypothetical protein